MRIANWGEKKKKEQILTPTFFLLFSLISPHLLLPFALPNVSQLFQPLKSVDQGILWSTERTTFKPLSDYQKYGRAYERSFEIKRLYQKELASRPVDLSFHGPEALSLFKLKIMGTTADKICKKSK